MDSKIIKIILILVFLKSTAQAVEFKGKFIQGHYIIGKTDPTAQITIDRKKIKVTKDGFFAFGLGRDRKNDVLIIKSLNGEDKKIIKKFLKENTKYKGLMG